MCVNIYIYIHAHRHTHTHLHWIDGQRWPSFGSFRHVLSLTCSLSFVIVIVCIVYSNVWRSKEKEDGNTNNNNNRLQHKHTTNLLSLFQSFLCEKIQVSCKGIEHCMKEYSVILNSFVLLFFLFFFGFFYSIQLFSDCCFANIFVRHLTGSIWLVKSRHIQ